MQLLTIFGMLVAAGGVVFALQNHETVALSLFAWRFEASLAVVVLLALALGGMIVALVSTPATLRRQWELNRQQKRIQELELRVETLQREASSQAATNSVPNQPGSLYKEMPQLIATGSGKE